MNVIDFDDLVKPTGTPKVSDIQFRSSFGHRSEDGGFHFSKVLPMYEDPDIEYAESFS